MPLKAISKSVNCQKLSNKELRLRIAGRNSTHVSTALRLRYSIQWPDLPKEITVIEN